MPGNGAGEAAAWDGVIRLLLAGKPAGEAAKALSGCIPGAGFAVRADVPEGKAVEAAMTETFRRTPGDLAERLLSALEAGDVVGGDRRAKRTAVLVVVPNGVAASGGVESRAADRVEPVRDLRRQREAARKPDPAAPAIVTREEWGAKPVKGPGKFQFPERITIHHAGVTYKTDKPWVTHVRGLQRYSQEDKPWIDIPYHYCVAQDGTIYEARSHYLVGDTNTEYDPTGHFLIDVLGNFEEEPVVEKQVEATARLAVWAAKKFGVPAERIKTHKDYSKQTVCPGRNLYALFKDGSFVRKVGGS